MDNNDLNEERLLRMRELLLYPELGHNPVDFTNNGTPIKSNCFGTAFYVIGTPRLIDESHFDDLGMPMLFLPGDLPGYINGIVASTSIREKWELVSSPKLWDLVSFWDNNKMNHIGVMGDGKIMFNQWGFGGRYELRNIDSVMYDEIRFHRQRMPQP